MPEFKENKSPAMKRTPYKMKGSPMQRNFGIGGSPLQENGKGTNWAEQYRLAKAEGSGATKEQIRKIKRHMQTQEEAEKYLASGKASGKPGEKVIKTFASGERTLKPKEESA